MTKVEEFLNGVQAIARNLQAMALSFQQWAQSIDWVKVENVFEYLTQQWPKELRQLSIDLANRGWFIWVFDDTLGDAFTTIQDLKGKAESDQDRLLQEYLEAKLALIEAELSAGYPDRSDLIKDAFGAHRAGFYGASVTALLALSEGICRDLFPGIGLYSKHPNDTKKKKKKTRKPGIPKTDDIFDNVAPLDIFDEAVLIPLRIRTSLTESIHHPSDDQHSMFNRHLIMHGASKRYGHKTNSLKAVGLAFFVHKALHHIKELPADPTPQPAALVSP